MQIFDSAAVLSAHHDVMVTSLHFQQNKSMDSKVLQSRVRGALFGLLAGDALAMPVHWFYNTADIVQFARSVNEPSGRLTRYHDAPRSHPSSIMPYASTAAGGRGSQAGSVIGDVILHTKKHRWGVPNVHYHEGMKAGENTLNSLVTRVLWRGMVSQKEYSSTRFLKDYVAFMTTPGTHRDTYAESYHRDFFRNYANGIPPEKCCGAEGHDTPSMGGLVMLPPVALSLHHNPEVAIQKALQHLALTHESRELQKSAQVYVELLLRILHRPASSDPQIEVRKMIEEACAKLNFDVRRICQDPRAVKDDKWIIGNCFSPACYISGSLPGILALAWKYVDNFALALEANVNVGGDNCHRGSALGALMGAALGYEAIPDHFINGLSEKAAIEAEINAFVDTFVN